MLDQVDILKAVSRIISSAKKRTVLQIAYKMNAIGAGRQTDIADIVAGALALAGFTGSGFFHRQFLLTTVDVIEEAICLHDRAVVHAAAGIAPVPSVR